MKHFFVKLQKKENDAICKEHSLSLDFYCTVCKEIICMDCFILLHKQHETKTIKYARDQALDLVDSIESIRDKNASGCDQIYQRAQQMQINLEESEGDIIKRVEEIETKIQGLISSIFKKTKLYYGSYLGKTKELLQDILNQCETSKKSKELSVTSDLQLACLLEELVTAREEEKKETVSMEKMVQTLNKTDNAPIMIANEEGIFNSVIDLFNHINLFPTQNERSISHEFTFEGYNNGEYVNEMVEEEINDAASSPVEELNGM